MQKLLNEIELKGSVAIELQESTIEVFLNELNEIGKANGKPTVILAVVDPKFLGIFDYEKPAYLLTFEPEI
jgi:hypothetical protein